MPKAHHTEVLLSYPCPSCDAGPGDWCMTINGERKHEFHVARSNLAAANDWQLPEEG